MNVLNGNDSLWRLPFLVAAMKCERAYIALLVCILFSMLGSPLDVQASPCELTHTNHAIKYTRTDLKIFSQIQKYYPQFQYSSNYLLENSQPAAKYMVFPQKAGLYFSKYSSFQSVWYTGQKMIHYKFHAENGQHGRGSYQYFSKSQIVHTQWRCINTCKLSIFLNGNPI